MSAAVDAFRGISWLVFKWLLIAIATFIAIGALIGGGMYGYHWYSHERHQENVKLLVNSEHGSHCPKDFPIHVLIANASGRIIEKVEFRLAARNKGRSSDIAKYHSYNDDHIIPPKEGYGLCWAVPELSEKIDNPLSLDWSIAQRYVRFQD